MSGFPTGLGDYEVRGVLGSGASGTVYLAHQEFLDRDVAIKELSTELTANPTFRERFRAEAEIMAQLDNDNCVRVFDYFQRDANDYLVSELVDGASLRAVLQHSGQLRPEEALGVVKGALTGLARAHMLGLLHRDIKPENVLVDREGVSKLADFGQAGTVVGNGPGASSAGFLGSPAYMAPEVIAGGEASVQSDIYSVGAMLFELLTGRPPYVADSPLAVMRMHTNDPVPDPRQFNPNLSAGVAGFLMNTLAKDRGTRPSSTHSTMSTMRAVAAEAYGEDWESRSSIKRKVAAAMGAGLGLLAGFGAAGALAAAGTVGSAVTSGAVLAAAGTTGGVATVGTAGAGGVLGVSTWLVAAGGAVVLAGAVGGILFFSGAFSPKHGAPLAVVTSPSPTPTEVLASASASPSPTDTPTPTPSPSPSPSATATTTTTTTTTTRATTSSTTSTTSSTSQPPPPPKAGPITVGNLDVFFAYCDAAGNNCTPAPPKANDAATAGQGGYACASTSFKFWEQYSWTYAGPAGTSTPITVTWTGIWQNAAGATVPVNTGPLPSDTVASGSSNSHPYTASQAEVLQPGPTMGPTTYSMTFQLDWTTPDGGHGPQQSPITYTWKCG